PSLTFPALVSAGPHLTTWPHRPANATGPREVSLPRAGSAPCRASLVLALVLVEDRRPLVLGLRPLRAGLVAILDRVDPLAHRLEPGRAVLVGGIARHLVQQQLAVGRHDHRSAGAVVAHRPALVLAAGHTVIGHPALLEIDQHRLLFVVAFGAEVDADA